MKIHRVILVAGLIAAVSGCIRVDQTLTINKDGSGELEMSYSMKEQAIQQMEAMTKAQAGQSGEDSNSDADQFNFDEKSLRKQLAAHEKQGIKIISIDSETADGWKTMKVKLGFDDLNALAKTEMMQDNDFSIKKTADGNFIIRQTSGDASDAGGDEEMNPQMIEQMAPMFAGMRIVQRIKVPGKLIKSNATEVDGNTASWIYDVDKDPTVLNKMKNIDMKIEFEGKGVNLKEI